MSRRWQEQEERSSGVWVWAIRAIALHLGRPLARLLLYPITGYFFLFSRGTNRHSRAYLGRALGRPARSSDVWRHIHAFAATILDRVFLLSGRDDLLDIRIHGEHLVHSKTEAGQGCLLLGAHLGSFEVLRALGVHRKQLALSILMYPEHNQTVTRLLHALSPKIAETVIPLGRADTLLKVKERLDRGELIGMLGDRVDGSDKQVVCDFLGSPTRFPAGPALLAVALKVPVVLFYGLYRGGNRYDIHIELLTEVVDVPRSERPAKVEQLTCRYARRLEYHARHAPYNWFNFYDYWESP